VIRTVAAPIPALLFLTVLVFISGSAFAATAGERCDGALAQSHRLMTAEPVLKEELATGVMWMRLDAESLRAAGRNEDCADIAERALRLLRSYRDGQSAPSPERAEN
jgi:hypothetical protein